MTTRRSASSPASKTRKRLNKRRAELRRRAEQRRLELEKLEDRVVLTGPQLAGILPNGEELLDTDGTTRLNIAPRELTISFDETQQFNDAAIQDSIRLIRSGGDMAFGDANDVVITPGFLGSRDAPNGHQIVMRFQDSLPDDHYRVELFAFDDGSQNITALRNINGEVLQSPQGLDRISVDFELDLGAQIISVVPQPIRRDPNTGDLIQDDQQIVVYFNDDDLHEEKVATGDKNPDPTVVDPAFYQLHFTNDTASNQDDLALFGPNGFANPQSVVYDPALDVAVLTFAQPLQNLSPTGGAATWRLRIGTDEAIAAPPDPPVDLLGPGTADVGFDISLLFPDDSLTESQQEIIRDAADRWEQIIIGDLPNEGLIDDIEITVRAQPGDGVGANWILGDSGPTANRRDSFLPYKGEIRFDSFDVRDREIHQQQVEAGLLPDYNVPTLFETAAREIGHALGFRRIWDELGLIQGAGTADPRFSGAIATAEYNAALNISGVSVPLENTTDREDLFGTFDTRETKWREQFFEPTTNGGDLTVSTLQNELFSGYLSQPELPTMRQPHLISRVTIGAFADMGYEVDLNAADDMVNQLPYIPPVEMAATDEPGSSFDTAFDLEPNLNTTLGVTVSALVHSSIDDSFHSNGLINVIADGSHLVDGSFLIIRAADGDEHLFEFNDSLNPGSPTLENPGAGTSLVPFTVNDTIEQVRDSLFTAIDANGIVAVSKFSDHFILLDGDSHDLRSSVRLSGNIAGVTTMDPLLVNFDEAGGQDEPGHRDNQVEEHIRGDRKDVTNGITTVYYNFKDHYGFDIDGNALDNTITETQKLRAREIFELYNNFLGVQFVETASEGITIVTGDMRAVREDVPTGPGDALSISGGGIVVMDAAEAWNDDFGGNWYREATRQIGKALGMGNSFELPLGTVQGLDLESPLASTTNPDVGVVNTARPEPVFPGDHDLVHGERLYRPEQNDLDIYRIRLDESGLLSIETFAERLANSSPLDTTVTLWTTKVDTNGNIIFDSDGRERQQLIARNDDYFSEDSFLQLELDAGVYFIGVSASGNDTYDPTIENTGYGGKTEGDYDLRVSFRPASDDGIIDDTSVRLDGDSDGRPGGEYNFWFRTAQPSDGNPIGTGDAVVYVDKVNEPPVGQAQPNGTLANPFNTIVDATDFISTRRAGDPESEFIIRIVGNGGSDDDLRTVGDNAPYEIGFRPPFNIPLEDGARLDVPPNTVVMIDEGAVLKFRGSSINVGSESPAIDRSGGAVQLLGTPFLLNDARDDFLRNGLNDPVVGSVFMTSWDDEAIGADTNPAAAQDPARGDWGGVLFRTDQENVEARKQWEDLGIFLNYVNHTDFRYGGGKIVLNSVQTTVAPIHMIEARPTVSFNTFTENASAGLSADPNSFLESTFHDPATQFIALFTSDYTRIGPDVHNNRLSSNQTNGMAIRIDTLPGNNLRPQTVSARWDDTDIVHVLTNPLILQGTPGGAFLDKTIVPVDLVTFPPVINGATGSLNAGDLHRYRVTFIDAEGNESPPSVSTPRVGQVNVDGVIDINNLPPTPFGSVFIGRRIYRSDALVQVTTIQSASAVLNEIQHVLLPGPPSGSTFILDFAGVSTAPISDGASDAEVLAALEALPTIAPGDVAVALIPGGWSVEFTGKFANLDVAEMVGDSGNYTMIAQRDASDTTYEDDGTTIGGMLDIGVTATSGLRRARPDARLRIDGGTVVKMDQARIEVGVGAQLLAEGDSGNQVVITSRRDDRFGGLGTFDTNNDDGFGALETAPVGGDWGGVIVRPGGSNDLRKRASLLRRDSIHGPFSGEVQVDEEDKALIINGSLVHV
ncbi:MAG: hypothetical protein QF805_12920, partial [Pirellulaceae bacterium]|nr:hypothetical protein [Pirellulaceae bacterium]